MFMRTGLLLMCVEIARKRKENDAENRSCVCLLKVGVKCQ